MTDILKTWPHSKECEEAVLGGLMLDGNAMDRIGFLKPEHFYLDANRRIYGAISVLAERGHGVDMVLVAQQLEKSGDLDKAGGQAYIGGLALNGSGHNIAKYAEVIYEKSLQRQLVQECWSIAEQVMSGAVSDSRRMLDEAESRILRIAEVSARQGEGPVDLKPLLAKVFERIDHLYHRDDPSGVIGVPTGFLDLDQKTSGFQPGDLVIVAGRPSLGKTAFALNIAEHVAVDNGLPVVIFSMEMSGTQLATRMLGSIARVNQHKMRTGRLNDQEWSALSGAMSKLHEAPIQIDEGASLTALEVRARARRLKRRHGKLGLVVIDYIQLMESKAERVENRATEISEISRALKAMAKELDVPVVALSQLNRAVDQRPDRRPVMSDLRESGAIEQDADVILFLYREAAYKPDLPEEQRTNAEVIIGKQRNGPIGVVPLIFHEPYTRFENHGDLDGFWAARRQPKGRAKVSNFHDFKSAAAGDSGA